MCMYPSPRGIGIGIGSSGDAAEVSRTLHHVLSGGKSFKDAVKVFSIFFPSSTRSMVTSPPLFPKQDAKLSFFGDVISRGKVVRTGSYVLLIETSHLSFLSPALLLYPFSWAPSSS